MRAYALEDKNIQLLYLTLHGSKPSANSIGETPKECIRQIGYNKEIKQWLTNCLEDIKADSISYVIHQYLKTIASL